MLKQVGIYQILHIDSNKRYIGSSTDIYHRLHHHKGRLKVGKHANDYLQKAYDKYGLESFEFKQILECSEEDLEFYEQHIIDGYQSNKREFGFNLREVSGSNRGMATKKYSHKAGDTYNRLTLIHPTTKKNNKLYWLVKCSCGVTKEINPAWARSGHSKSCGCLCLEKKIERIKDWNKTNPDPWNKKEISKKKTQNFINFIQSLGYTKEQIENISTTGKL